MPTFSFYAMVMEPTEAAALVHATVEGDRCHIVVSRENLYTTKLTLGSEDIVTLFAAVAGNRAASAPAASTDPD